jgi:hypothetical protein
MTIIAVFILGSGFGSILTFMRLSEENESLQAKLRKTQALLDLSLDNEKNLKKLNEMMETVSDFFLKKKDQE